LKPNGEEENKGREQRRDVEPAPNPNTHTHTSAIGKEQYLPRNYIQDFQTVTIRKMSSCPQQSWE
jgi:hypothetical protein